MPHSRTSTAAAKGHPLHPMIIPLPITFLITVLITDIVWWFTGDDFWARVSIWLLGAGVVTGMLAGIVGSIDFFTIKQAREGSSGWIHAVGNIAVIIIAAINWIIRIDALESAILPWGVIMSAIVALLLVITGWYGGELSYRYRIGVIEQKDLPEEQPGAEGRGRSTTA